MTAWCLTLQSYCTSVFTSFGRMASDIILRIRTALRQCLGCHNADHITFVTKFQFVEYKSICKGSTKTCDSCNTHWKTGQS